MAGRFYSSLADFVVRRRGPVLACWLAATVALGWLGSRISLNADVAALLPEGTRSADDLRFYLARFGSPDALFFVLGSRGEPAAEGSGSAAGDGARPSGSGQEAGFDDLEAAAEILAERLVSSGLVRDVRYGVTEEEGMALAGRALAHLPVLVPVERLEELRARLRPEAIDRAMSRLRAAAAGPLLIGPREKLAVADPLGLIDLTVPAGPLTAPAVRPDPETGLMLSPDGRALLLVASPVRPPQDVEFSRLLLQIVERVEADLAREAPEVAADHAGGHLFSVQDESRIRHDVTWTASLSMAAVLALLGLVLRRPAPLLVLALPLSLSMLWTLGLAAIWPGQLNAVTVAFAAILLGMGDDSLTHLYLRTREEMAAGAGREEAILRALAATGPPIVVATLTTGLAFGTLMFVRFRGLSELGLIAALGMVVLLASSLLLFPALLSLWPSAVAAPPPRLPVGPLLRFHRWARSRRAAVLAAAALAVAGAGAAAWSGLSFSSDLRGLRGDDPARERLERLLRPFGGAAEPIHVVHDAADLERSLHAAERLASACLGLQREGWIAGCASPTAWLPSQATQRARFESVSRLPWAEAARRVRDRAEALGMEPEAFAPFLRSAARYASWEQVRLDPDAGAGLSLPGTMRSGTAVLTTLHPAPGRGAPAVVARARALVPEAFDPAARVASVGLVVSDLAALLEDDFRRASILALVVVAATAAAAFRSPRQLALVGVPVAAGCLLMLGGLALLGVPINVMNLVATPLVLGLGVDFGVHLVARHEREGGDLETTLRHTGGAILLTGLTTMTGFGSLLAAEFAGLRSIGWVAVLGIGGCLAASLLLLPLLLPARRP